MDAAREAGKLLEDLPTLWGEANLTERRKLLPSMLDAVYVDTVEEKAVVAIRPKPALRPLFEIATTREGSGVVLINETPPEPEGSEAYNPCFWWRRGRVELQLKHGLAVLLSVTCVGVGSQLLRPSTPSWERERPTSRQGQASLVHDL